ncbi:PREDICTED: probable serine/threonine protein kinase IREH1 isoform X1 [Lupinus angustifolius]|uniref:probable serine/threonine protein kinase IREH1 isoform X1 n=1 Tax=Lupinus angustifolius TaxID=3871 RepID=UPI00092EED47|nr:PREDICTED: probable serine/threonine protein kinase IREH1 isoform X1 [Lupinus angustifolius]XP_019431658.1 PREDICTED: probable serine/threonine protein kinase IREH1 isoform X1 [Lupinus angustifolius]
MVFKGRFFSSSKKSDSDGSSNSPRSISSNSPSRSDKKKLKDSKKSNNDDAAKSKSSPTGSSSPSPSPSSSVSPILASSLGLNKIKTRSGPLPQESFFSFRNDNNKIGASNLSKSDGKKEVVVVEKQKSRGSIRESFGSDHSVSPGTGATCSSREDSPNVLAPSPLQNRESSSNSGRHESSWAQSGGLRNSDASTPEVAYDYENPKESESPRFQAILRVTSAPRKRFPADIKSFSHELNSTGVRPFPFWKPRRLNNVEEILDGIRAKFDKAKDEVNSDLAIFAADLIGILEKDADTHPEWQETIEDLLILARRCAMTSPGEFWLQCEGTVQELDDRRQELPPGMLKQLHTRMLFILTRCTRLLQFHKESGLAEDEVVFNLRQSRVLHSAAKCIPPGLERDGKSSSAAKASKASTKKAYSQEQHILNWKKDVVQPQNLLLPPHDDPSKHLESPPIRNRMSFWKKFPSPPGKSSKETQLTDQNYARVEPSKVSNKKSSTSDADSAAKPSQLLPVKESQDHASKHQHKVSWGYWGDQHNIGEESSIICRICEEEVPTSHVEDHSRICAVANKCDQKGLSVNERLLRIAETLEKMMESCTQKDVHNITGSPDVSKLSNLSMTEESDVLSPKLSDWSRRGSQDMLDCYPEADNSVFMDELKGLPLISCRTRFGPKSDQGMTTSSAGSMTPRSPLMTPTTSQIDLLLAGKGAFSEHDDLPQMNELADIARCVANTPLDDDRTMSYLLSCLDDLRVVGERRKYDALTVETFATRIEKLIREKYLQLTEMVDVERIDITSTVIDEDAPLDDDVIRSLRTSPVHSSADRTSIDDFEIIKPISRGAFGRVFLAKKRTTGDLFAIKVLKKADMIRKNAVESILAERDILITVRNPFVVRFFYSFTCRENLYLVMEYLNGGDLYSLLRNLGCIDEEVARVYIAEVVLALEYLHSLRVVHRDLKPDNLLIAHDGHVKLTDFGLSKVGLINSTDDLSGPAVCTFVSSILGEDEPRLPTSEHQQELRKKRSAVGTPDYLAPEILLGTGHGYTADWWSVGVILFELLVGIPPFNAEHPQSIFDNILNRKIPWPAVPEEMSPEAHDLIDRLLTEDPNQRLGARGASEVKEHVFFKDINWDTLARQKAAFVPASESALDTSYFTSRYSWNTSDGLAYPASDIDDSSDADSLSGSSSCLSNRQDEVQGDECQGLADFDIGSSMNYSFSNFSFKNLSQLASINYDLLTKGLKDDPSTHSSQ